jgi:hypothetical protein
MKKRKGIDPDRPVGNLTIIPDYLPPPEELLPPGSRLKVTLALDEESVDFFKKQARRHGGKYQRMMREVLRRYALHHSGKKAA